ncbi:MAG: LytR family transcriptional regulator, partial [Slackia sp.]|nr:LytR family transcriptional regulator [Slackia sp.]
MVSRRRDSLDNRLGNENARFSSTPRVQGSGQEDGASTVRSYSRRAYGSGDSPRASVPYSRESTGSEYSRMRSRKKRKKVIVGVVAAVVALAVIGVGATFAYMGVLNGKLSKGIDEDTQLALTDKSLAEPFYMLLMGTDKSQERDASGEYGDSYRSDSTMLARIDPVQKKVTLISIERDTLVNIEGYGVGKINSAYTYGGPALMVKTVSQFAGVPISHYAEINFDGFKSVVDALGGVDVNVPITIDDADAGGHVDAGEQTINGDQALILCRARNAYEEAGYGGGDYYRAANQRMVLGAIAKKLLASDPATMANTVTALCDYVTTDMSVTDIAAVANSMRGMDPSTDIYSTMNPTTSSYEDGGWYEYSNNEAWAAMMKRIDQGLSPTPDESASMNNGGVTDGS